MTSGDVIYGDGRPTVDALERRDAVDDALWQIFSSLISVLHSLAESIVCYNLKNE